MQTAVWKQLEAMIHGLRVLVVDDNQYMRKLVRSLLLNVGIKEVHEAADGIDGLEAIRTLMPDLVILDWEMPLLNGPEMVRIIRSPGVFPAPGVPIIMLTAHGERWRVVEAVRLGINEFMVKPVSAKGLYDRIVSIFAAPRPLVKLGDYYGPQPRNSFSDPVKPLDMIAAPAPNSLRH